MNNMLRAGLRNRTTTWLAIAALLVLVGQYITSRLDQDPTTVPDLDSVMTGLFDLLIVLGLVAARDAEKSTEESRGLRSKS